MISTMREISEKNIEKTKAYRYWGHGREDQYPELIKAVIHSS
jgi:hypothetical protein